MEALTRLKQTSSVVAYKGDFEILSNKLLGLSKSHKLSYFFSGLKDEFRLLVRMLVPKSFNEAFGLAKIQEEYLLSSRKGFRGGVIDNGKLSILGLPKFENNTDQKLKLPLQRLTSAQMEERRKLGLCYKCDEKWQMGHRCKEAKLFLLEGCDIEIEQKSRVQLVELEDDGVMLGHQEVVQASENIIAPVEITLYALVGSPSSQTMRVRGRIKNREVVSLIDFGRTHNFLDATDLDNLRLSLDTSQILEVKVVNGSIVKTVGVCHGVTFFIQGYKFVLDLNVLHFGGGGEGVQWFLELNGKVHWVLSFGISTY